MKEKRYIIKYKGKEHISLGENSVNAVERFLDRPMFGRTDWNGGFKLDMYDADTRGERWCTGSVRWLDAPISAELATDE